ARACGPIARRRRSAASARAYSRWIRECMTTPVGWD
ncbi:MAG: hypothetical protein AVDCRST_MAG30-677, partial [uncultured Solirubrobacteraceae bacterium]